MPRNRLIEEHKVNNCSDNGEYNQRPNAEHQDRADSTSYTRAASERHRVFDNLDLWSLTRATHVLAQHEQVFVIQSHKQEHIFLLQFRFAQVSK